jgi:hypothetical protein
MFAKKCDTKEEEGEMKKATIDFFWLLFSYYFWSLMLMQGNLSIREGYCSPTSPKILCT